MDFSLLKNRLNRYLNNIQLSKPVNAYINKCILVYCCTKSWVKKLVIIPIITPLPFAFSVKIPSKKAPPIVPVNSPK